MRRLAALISGIVGVIIVLNTIGPRSKASAPLINGAGATFPYPLYSKWFYEYQKIDLDTEINYQSIGSGGGIRQLLARTIDFGATDTPMTSEQLAKAPAPILHIPMVVGAVVLSYNLPGVPHGLKLSPSVLAEIFLGKINRWDDRKIVDLNPEFKLPAEDIIVVRRSDGSGTTAVLTDYLSKVSAEWKEKVGSGTAVSWPEGLGAKGNEGVAGLVKQTPGALGYIELVYAINNNLAYASVRNKSGHFILPTLGSVSSAAENSIAVIPRDFRASITDAPGRHSYPLSAFTYLLVYQSMPFEKGTKIKDFLFWAIKGGQAYAENLGYAPLPQTLVRKIESQIKNVHFQ